MKETKRDELMMLDKERLAYMVAWRDAHIKKMQDRLAGCEEINEVLQTLLFYALAQSAKDRGDGVREIRVPKAEITASLHRWGCDTADGGDAYLISFTEGGRAEDGEGEAE